MHDVMQPIRDPGWVLTHEGYNVLTENAVESRFALGNGFLGMRASRPVTMYSVRSRYSNLVDWRNSVNVALNSYTRGTQQTYDNYMVNACVWW